MKTFSQFTKGQKRLTKKMILDKEDGNWYYNIDDAIENLKNIKKKYKNCKDICIEITTELAPYEHDYYEVYTKYTGVRKETIEEFNERIKNEYDNYVKQTEWDLKQYKILKEKLEK